MCYYKDMRIGMIVDKSKATIPDPNEILPPTPYYKIDEPITTLSQKKVGWTQKIKDCFRKSSMFDLKK